MKDFQYKPIDTEGHNTLDAVAEARQFNYWMYQTIAAHCTGRILEIGSGIGNISTFFLEKGHPIFLSDVRPNYLAILREKFDHFQNLQDTVLMDLTDPDFTNKFSHMLHTFDTVFALNVVEHIKNDHLAIQNAYKLLKPGGRIIILVPAYPILYNRFDAELEHYRRYNQTSLDHLLKNNGFSLIHHQYFNFPGIFGWVLSGGIFRKKTIPSGQMKLYDKLVPLFKLFDKIIFNSMGLSVISVGQKSVKK